MRHIDFAKSQSVAFRFFTSIVLCSLMTATFGYAADRSNLASAASAYVYIGSLNGSADSITGLAVAADGSVRPVPGSPFNLPSISLIASGNHLFGEDMQNIASYSVGSNGTLSETSVVNGLAYIQDPGGQYVSALNIDRAGQVLNSVDTCGSCNSEILPWVIGSDGQLSYMSSPTLQDGPAKWQGVMTFSPDNRFAYTPIAQDFGILRRNANGAVVWINPGPVYAPPLPNPGEQVCNITTVASSVQGFLTLGWYGGGMGCSNGYVLGNYTVSSTGSLNFVPGSQIAPAVRENAMAFDSSGSYLAVAGNGIQVLKLRSDGTMSVLGAPVQVQGLNYVLWDNANHVYALGDSLYIFNFNGQTLTQAPGSPHAIDNPASLAVVVQ